ncbi:hypothetical protein PMIN03_003435 [Paraphaeosphaeria minitans]
MQMLQYTIVQSFGLMLCCGGLRLVAGQVPWSSVPAPWVRQVKIAGMLLLTHFRSPHYQLTIASIHLQLTIMVDTKSTHLQLHDRVIHTFCRRYLDPPAAIPEDPTVKRE